MNELQLQIVKSKLALMKGGQGSGNFGHSGRPGQVGGSSANEAGHSAAKAKKLLDSIKPGQQVTIMQGPLLRSQRPGFKAKKMIGHALYRDADGNWALKMRGGLDRYWTATPENIMSVGGKR